MITNQQKNLFESDACGALFNDSRSHRFILWRIWNEQLPKVMFIGLNPSTANENSDDPTIRRVIGFAKDWGYGGLYMLNLFTFVTAYPDELKECADPLFRADEYLKKYSLESDKVIFAWGNFKEAFDRGNQVKKMFDGYHLGLNANGTPKHPLYLPKTTKPIQYEQN